MQIYFVISKFSVRFYFPEGASPNHAGVTTRSVASRKVALGDQYTKGSETAKVGTDEQKRHKRHWSKSINPLKSMVHSQRRFIPPMKAECRQPKNPSSWRVLPWHSTLPVLSGLIKAPHFRIFTV